VNSIPVKTLEISHGLDLLKLLPEANSLASLASPAIDIGVGVLEAGFFDDTSWNEVCIVWIRGSG
jgi:hypothetical protein